MRAIQPGKKLVQDYGFVQPKLPTDRPIAQYIRQSTEAQVQTNKSMTVMQDNRMRQYLISLGWREDLIIKFDQDQAVSGTKGIYEREGMKILARMLRHGEIGAVACFSESRLFRDLMGVSSSTFVELCSKHKVPVITKKNVYWTGNLQDVVALKKAFDRAAEELEDIKERLLPARLRTIEEDISYGGHCTPVGFIIASELNYDGRMRRFYTPYPPHAQCVVWLFKRYREMDGNMGRLLHELRATKFAFPAFVGVDRVPHLSLDKDEHGNYPIKSYNGLRSLLTNPAYIGWYVYDGMVVSREAHLPIVSYEDFGYARSRLAATDLNGEPNENKPPVNKHPYKREHRALLEGVLMAKGCKVYAMHKGLYVAVRDEDGMTEINIPTKLLDRDFSAGIRILLAELEQRHKQGLKDSLHQALLDAQAEKLEQTNDYEEQLAAIDKKIRGWELDKVSAREQGYKAGLDKANEQLKILHAAREVLETKQQQAGNEKEELAECMSLLDIALHGWNKLKFERQRRFVQLMIKVVRIEAVSSHIVKMEIELKPPFNYSLESHVFRHFGTRSDWSDDEKEILRRLYPKADRAEILRALPTRTWKSCIAQANGVGRMNLERHTRRDTSGIHEELSWQDAAVMRKLGMNPAIAPWTMDTKEDPMMTVGEQYVPLHELLTDEEVQRRSGLGPIGEQEPPPEPELEEWPEQVPAPEEEDNTDFIPPFPYIITKQEIPETPYPTDVSKSSLREACILFLE